MPAPRLNDSQKEELVVRYRQGETAQALAAAYGCSPNTVSRVLKAALDPKEMEAIKRQSRGNRPLLLPRWRQLSRLRRHRRNPSRCLSPLHSQWPQPKRSATTTT
ncbi:helix-turn-helix domain-containing protein [Synechococcus sp. CB0101]|uniref:helix-turn-helix domain-containing protein n=1 Tax=Synechococcus sp. CB0101 TaxID=232348 RepID=UPI00352B5C9E